MAALVRCWCCWRRAALRDNRNTAQGLAATVGTPAGSGRPTIDSTTESTEGPCVTSPRRYRGCSITAKWPAQAPDRLQLYSLPTPNGVKVSIFLEETGLPYEVHRVSFDSNDQMSPEFLSLEPEQQDPGDHRPRRPRRRTAAAVRVGRDPDLPGRQVRAADATRCRRALRDDPVADVPDGRHRTDLRPGRLLPQVRRQGLRRQAPARPLRRPSPSACSRCSIAARRTRVDHGRASTRSPTSPRFRGSTTWSRFYGAGALVGFDEFVKREPRAASSFSRARRSCAG